MRRFACLCALVAAGLLPAAAGGAPGGDVLHGTMSRLNGRPDDLARYRGKVVMVVNTASFCVNTPQYGQLEKLYRAERARGFVILGFPSNDFGQQEPGSAGEIAKFCRKNFGVTFPMFSKTHVRGAGAAPLWRALTAAAGPANWNFSKYLLDRRGRVVHRYDAFLSPRALRVVAAIDRLL